MVLLNRIALLVLLAALAVRPLLSETFQPLEVSFLSALQERGGPTPAATAWLDWLLLTAAAWTLARHPGWQRLTITTVGVAVLITAVILGSLAAGDRCVALLAGSNLAVSVLAGCALAVEARQRAVQAPDRHGSAQLGSAQGLILAALLATGATTALKCWKQELSENPLLRQQWETVYKPKLLTQGFDPTDPLLVNFERRMQAGEVYGFLTHPNVAASCLMMWLLVSAGLLIGGSPGLAARAVLFATCAALAGVLWLTGSRGAQVGAAAGAAALLGLGWRAGWCARHPRRLLALLSAGYVTIIAAGVAYGAAKGTLPHPSLAFRWQYWTAALAAYQDAPLTGVGRENFDTAYLRHKSPAATEEVKNPHNLWISLLVELGPLGLVAGGLLVAGVLYGALRGLAQTAPPGAGARALRTHEAWPVIVGVLLLHALFSGTPVEGLGGLVSWIEDIALPWPLAFALALWLVRHTPVAERIASWVAAGCVAALLAAFTHGLLDFALLTPGGLAVFVLCAVAAGTAQPPLVSCPVSSLDKLAPSAPEGPRLVAGGATPGQRPIAPEGRRYDLRAAAMHDANLRNATPAAAHLRRVWLWPVAAGVVAVHLGAVAWPTAAAVAPLDRIEQAARTSGPQGAALLRRELTNLPTGGSAAVARAAARTAWQMSGAPGLSPGEQTEWLEQARAAAQRATQNNALDTNNYVLLARVHEALAPAYERSGRTNDAAQARHAAAETWEFAVTRYPTNPRTRISAGRAWFELWQRSADPNAAQRARAHFTAALSIDDTRPPGEVVRLRAQEREPLAGYLAQLAAGAGPPNAAAENGVGGSD